MKLVSNAITCEVMNSAASCDLINPMTMQPDLSQTLQHARRARRLSQLELSLRVGVSQRHVSFVESGRAKPSRELLLVWLSELEVPLAQRNAALLQAGFAPVYGEGELAQLQSTEHEPVLQAVSHLLTAHDPMPAFVLDADWNLLQANRGARWLMSVLMPGISHANERLNLLDALIHPQGVTHKLINAHEVAPAMLAIVRADAQQHPALQPRAEALASVLKERFGSLAARTFVGPLPPVLTSRFATDHGELAFFSMFTTFGSPQHITLASLRIEHMFAADERTRVVLQREVSAL
jgi:transcriptional regulator with XRE-family HTH domain